MFKFTFTLHSRKMLGQSVYLVTLCLFWYAFSTGTNLLTKQVLNSFPYPFTITLTHFIAVVLCVRPVLIVSGTHGIRGTKSQRHIYHRQLLGLSIGKLFASVSSNISILRIPVSYAHTVKATMPVFTVVLSKCLLGESQAFLVYVTLTPIVGGVLMATISDIVVDIRGVMSALFSTGAFTLQNIYSKKAMRDIDVHQLQLLEHITLIALVLFIPVWAFVDGRLFLFGKADIEFNNFFHVLSSLAISALCNVGQNIFAFSVISSVSPLSYSIANVSKRIVIITGSLLYFRDPITVKTFMGMSVAIVGVLLYNLVRIYQRKNSSKPVLPLTTKDSKDHPPLSQVGRVITT